MTGSVRDVKNLGLPLNTNYFGTKGRSHRCLIEVDCSLGQFKSAKLKDKIYTINTPIFFTTLKKKKEIDAPKFQHLLTDGQLLNYVADAVSTSIRFLWSICVLLISSRGGLEVEQ